MNCWPKKVNIVIFFQRKSVFFFFQIAKTELDHFGSEPLNQNWNSITVAYILNKTLSRFWTYQLLQKQFYTLSILCELLY